MQLVGDSLTFLEDAVNDLLVLIGLYREVLQSPVAVPLEQRRCRMEEAEADVEVDYLIEEIPRAFVRADEGVKRVRTIVHAMKRFSHASATEVAPADLREAIETTLEVCRNEYKYVADVSTDFGDLPLVTCNVAELNQVFLNLIINSAQAIGSEVGDSGRRGEIRICTRLEDEHAVIVIADDGPGIVRLASAGWRLGIQQRRSYRRRRRVAAGRHAV